MSKASQKKMEYIASYEADNYDKVLIRLPKGTKARVQATGETINGFVNRLVKAELDGPASTPTAPEGYTLVPCRPDQEPLKVLLPVDKHYNQRIQQAVNAGHAPSRAAYVMRVLDEQLYKDFHSPAPRQYDLPDEFFTGDPADNPPPLF